MSRYSNGLVVCCLLGMVCSVSGPLFAQKTSHRVVTQGNGKLAIVDGQGDIEWEMPWGGIHDIHVIANEAGQPQTVMVQQGNHRVVEINIANKAIVWQYDSSEQNRDAPGEKVEIHAFQPLDNGDVMIAESGPARIIEVDREGKLVKQIPLEVDRPHPHTDTRLARKLTNGNYLVCHEGDGKVRQYDGRGKVVWEYEIPMFGREPKGGHGPESFGNKVFGAVQLNNGNILIATGNGHSVIEVTPEKEIVWSVTQNELPNINLAWVTTLEVLPNGHYVIGNCHAGPDNPLLVEIDPKTKRVVWVFDEFETFGNSVPNSQLLDVSGEVIR
ncbi:MAG: PQQ-binding-like beta-propeller repeat protein [Planctomycetaceae bacterium]|nr:PQQ-binding-like beta-propeller repeat protein [Planctomycetaceae bacterium]MCP4465050.1 PQQ-binding-like beta-propeller repeat protein [Planctomycetaceae bacterium]MDG1809249.1 PQQ-binding-like beta-propeller repeat protein [Pirellulaceae bacterium]MDG2105748.1 PQQ-binding-like beta-propeller repeat protein [Pirellulaceae bacterium]